MMNLLIASIRYHLWLMKLDPSPGGKSSDTAQHVKPLKTGRTFKLLIEYVTTGKVIMLMVTAYCIHPGNILCRTNGRCLGGNPSGGAGPYPAAVRADLHTEKFWKAWQHDKKSSDFKATSS